MFKPDKHVMLHDLWDLFVANDPDGFFVLAVKVLAGVAGFVLALRVLSWLVNEAKEWLK